MAFALTPPLDLLVELLWKDQGLVELWVVPLKSVAEEEGFARSQPHPASYVDGPGGRRERKATVIVGAALWKGWHAALGEALPPLLKGKVPVRVGPPSVQTFVLMPEEEAVAAGEVMPTPDVPGQLSLWGPQPAPLPQVGEG